MRLFNDVNFTFVNNLVRDFGGVDCVLCRELVHLFGRTIKNKSPQHEFQSRNNTSELQARNRSLFTILLILFAVIINSECVRAKVSVCCC